MTTLYILSHQHTHPSSLCAHIHHRLPRRGGNGRSNMKTTKKHSDLLIDVQVTRSKNRCTKTVAGLIKPCSVLHFLARVKLLCGGKPWGRKWCMEFSPCLPRTQWQQNSYGHRLHVDLLVQHGQPSGTTVFALQRWQPTGTRVGDKILMPSWLFFMRTTFPHGGGLHSYSLTFLCALGLH